MSEKTLDGEIRYYEDGTPATAENLNKPLEDLAKTGQYMSEAQFEKNRETNKSIYAGSGFTALGQHHPMGVVNQGIWTGSSSQYLNRFYWNRLTASGGIEEEDGQYAKVNVNGDIITIRGTRAGDHGEGVTLPEVGEIHIESNINNTGNGYKQSDIFILTDTTSEIYKDTISSTGADGAATIVNNNNGTWTYNRNDEDSYHAWYFESPHNTDKFILGAEYVLTFDMGSYTGGYNLSIAGKISEKREGNIVTIRFKYSNTDGYMYFNRTDKNIDIICSVSIKLYETTYISVLKDIPINTDLTSLSGYLRKTDELSRQDLVLLETWHELIDEKDIVYPYGNTQNTDNLSGTIEGDFVGSDTYSLYGQWESPGTRIGRGYKWSTLSEANKLELSSNKDNNIYKSEDGLVQVRYRIRVVKGLGNKWAHAEDSTAYLAYNYSGYDWLQPKGQKISINYEFDDEAPSDNGIFMMYDRWKTNFDDKVGAWIGSQSVSAKNNIYGYNGNCRAIPIALVQRRNKGAFDPVHNPEGSSVFSDGKEWYETSASHNNIIDCFNNAGDGDTITNVSGRPDKFHYDQVHESDIKDLRMSAHKVHDVEGFLKEKVKEFMRDNTRGTEKASYGLLKVASLECNGGNSYTFLEVSKYINSDGAISNNHFNFEEDNVYFHNRTTNAVSKLRQITGNTQSYHIHLCYTSGAINKNHVGQTGAIVTYGLLSSPISTTASDIIDVYVDKKADSLFNNNTMICDIIGDISNYPQEWKDNKIFGSPLIISEENESLSPSILSTNSSGPDLGFIKLSRNIEYSSDLYKCLVKKKDGTFINLNFGGVSFDAGDGNAIYINVNANTVIIGGDTILDLLGYASQEEMRQLCIALVFYRTKAKIFNIVNNSANIIADEDVFITNYRYSYGGYLLNDMLDKVSTGGTFAGYSCGRIKGRTGHNFLQTNNYHTLTHDEPKGSNGGGSEHTPTCKLLPYLINNNSRAQIKFVFKEMKWDQDLGSITREVDGTVMQTLVSKEIIAVNGGTLDGYVLQVPYDSDYNLPEYHIADNGIIYDSSNVGVSGLKLFDGNSWGDNNSFIIRDKVSIFTDDNGKTCLYGQKAIRLNHFLD